MSRAPRKVDREVKFWIKKPRWNVFEGPGWGGIPEAFNLSPRVVWGLQESKGTNALKLDLQLYMASAEHNRIGNTQVVVSDLCMHTWCAWAWLSGLVSTKFGAEYIETIGKVPL